MVDYGIGNLKSIFGSLNRLGCDVFLANTRKDFENSDLIILPGVGTFPVAIKNLKRKKLASAIKYNAARGKTILGICLGMQIFTDSSEEIQYSPGLKLIPGKIQKLERDSYNIGWKPLRFKKNNFLSRFKNKNFYFQHQYRYFGPKKFIISEIKKTETVPSIIKNKNIIGVQFHPEKSQENGLNFLEEIIYNF